MTYFSDVYRGRRVLVTGHTGFKGTWLVMWLRSLGAIVAGYSSEVPTQPSHFDLLGLQKQIDHYIGDVRDRSRLMEVVDEFRPEIIFHLAAQALVPRSYSDPVTTFETNVMGMVNLLECLRSRAWIEVAVLITSDKVYRNDEWCRGYRETDALGGYDPYSSSKSCADLVAQSYFNSFLRDSPTRVAIARAGNVIGGGDWSHDRIIPDCIRAWSCGGSVSIRSSNATRPWQHVLEPIGGYLFLGKQLLEKKTSINGEAFNFGPDASVNQTVAQLLEAMSENWSSVKWDIADGFEHGGHEAMLLKLSCDKVLFHLKWQAILQFHETVAMTVDWYRNWHDGGSSISNFTQNQIEQYSEMAKQRNAIWA